MRLMKGQVCLIQKQHGNALTGVSERVRGGRLVTSCKFDPDTQTCAQQREITCATCVYRKATYAIGGYPIRGTIIV